MVAPALEAAETLAQQDGINVRVIDARFVKPLDREMILKAAAETGTLITVEENALPGGFGSAVLECLEEAGVTVPVKRLGIPDRFIEQGPQQRLREDLGLDAAGIIQAVKAVARPKAKILAFEA
jgi:1-deoxy-D-xylulose-5-phosphate synthase